METKPSTQARHTEHTLIHSFIPVISIAPLQVLYYSDDIFVLLTKQSVDIPQLDYSEC